MAFKKLSINNALIESPEELFGDLRNRKVQGLLSQQADMLRAYLKNESCSDLALELPTGSGKTLVGLLIAEWRRRKYKQKCLFLCPTSQLVNQVAEQAQEKYGIKTVVFTGSKAKYSTVDTSKYESCETIAITTYSSLFNSNPYFKDADVLIFDDAHSAENYVSSCWCIEINDYGKTSSIFEQIKDLIMDKIDDNERLRFLHKMDDSIDLQHISKLPMPFFLDILNDLYRILETCTPGTDLQYSWQMLKNNLHACNLYFSSSRFLLRPFIPPTENFLPFINAQRRIYMSATLGEGGDLERIFGKTKITRIAAPKNYEKQGIGRRFFIFPMRMWEKEDAIVKTIDWIKKVPRTLILCPRDKDVKDIQEHIDNNDSFVNYSIYNAKDIETSKKDFISSSNAIAILANRYDGIDLSEDECRYLIINELPEATNLQEKFIISKLNSPLLFRERIKTRLIQALGRCTRTANDWAMVCILGEKLNQYLLSPQKTKMLPVELQAEIKFGIEQSSPDENFEQNINENIDAFLAQNTDWEEANDYIIQIREKMQKTSDEDIKILEEIASQEIKYINSLWNKDFNQALSIAIDIYTQLSNENLRGYKGLWVYMAANAAFLANNKDKARELYNKAGDIIKNLGWLKKISSCMEVDKLSDEDFYISNMLDNIEMYFNKCGYIEKQKFAKHIGTIINKVQSKNSKIFEQGQVEIGQLIGLQALNTEESGATDPIWILTPRLGLIFEDYTDTKETTQELSKKKVLQSSGHINQAKQTHKEFNNVKFSTIVCSGTTKLHPTAVAQAENLYFVSIEEFRDFSEKVVSFITMLWEHYSKGSPKWRDFAFNKIYENKFTPTDIYNYFTKTKLKYLND